MRDGSPGHAGHITSKQGWLSNLGLDSCAPRCFEASNLCWMGRRPASNIELKPAALANNKTALGAWQKAADADCLLDRAGSVKSVPSWATELGGEGVLTLLHETGANEHKGARQYLQGQLVIDARTQPIFSAVQGSGDC